MERFLLIAFLVSLYLVSGCTQPKTGSLDLSSTSGQPTFVDITKAEYTGHDTDRSNVYTSMTLNDDNTFTYKELFYDDNGSGEKCTLSGTWSVSSNYNLELAYTQVNDGAQSGTLTWDLYQKENSHIKFKIDSSLSPKDLVRESLLSSDYSDEVPNESGLTSSTHCLHN